MAHRAEQAYPIDVFVQVLRTLDHILEVAEASSEPGDAPDRLVRARLAPDMFDLAQHVVLTCRHALEAASQLTRQELAAFQLEAASLADLRRGVGQALETLQTLDRGAILEAPMIVQAPTGQQFRMTGWTMINDWALPQLYFHMVTVYAILRAAGVQLGIRDYLGHMGKYIVPA